MEDRGGLSASDQVIDIEIDPLDARRQRRRAWLRVGLPILGVVLMIASILAIAVMADRANRAGVLALSDELLDALENRIAEQVSAYLEPAAGRVKVARDVVQNGGAADRRRIVQAYAASVLRHNPQIAQLSFAAMNGNYMLVRRGEGGGIATKLIRSDPPPRLVEWVHEDAQGREIGRESDPNDDYDPRTRPWYQGALKSDDLFWTGVYVFYTDRAPGITAAIRYTDPDGKVFVLGVDIALKALSDFLASLRIGRTGRAFIVNGSGHLIAAPSADRLLRQTDNELVAVRVDELGDPVLTAAYDRFRVEGQGHRVVEVDGKQQITMVEKLPAAGNDWSVLIVVPEKEFTGFVAANNRKALLMAMAVVGLAALLAGLLVRQGLRADRAARALLDRTRAIEQQSTAFANLAQEVGLFDPEEGRPPRGLTETLGNVCGARRASVWRLTADRQVLRCEDSFERETGGHVGGLELSRDEMPQFFVHLLQGEEIEAADAAQDRRTGALYRTIMQPVGSQSLLVIPVRRQDRVVGAMWLEDSAGVPGVRDFARAVGNMVAVRMAEAADLGLATRRSVGWGRSRSPKRSTALPPSSRYGGWTIRRSGRNCSRMFRCWSCGSPIRSRWLTVRNLRQPISPTGSPPSCKASALSTAFAISNSWGKRWYARPVSARATRARPAG